MKQHNCIQETDWKKGDNELYSELKSKLLLNGKLGGCREFIVKYSEMEPGAVLPMHCHGHAHSDYIISGRVWAQLGCRRVELEVDSATYFPAGMPHAYKAVGREKLRYYSIYACEKKGQNVQSVPVNPDRANKIDRPNMDKTRWAVAESFETWYYWEPSKGPKGIRWTSLFDAARGGHEEMIVGTAIIPPGGRYSRHYHDQPEMFIGLGGRGVLFCGDDVIPMEPGVAAYVGKKQIHGAQTMGPVPMKMIWVYGTESASADWSWIPVEDIYLGAQPLNY